MLLTLFSLGTYLEEWFLLYTVTQLHQEAHFLEAPMVVTNLSMFWQGREGGLKDKNMQCLYQDAKRVAQMWRSDTHV